MRKAQDHDAEIGRLELWLASFYTTKIAYQLPHRARLLLASAAWWLAAISGLFELLSALELWRFAHNADRLANWVSSAPGAYGQPVHHMAAAFYVGTFALLANAGILLVAVHGLRLMRRTKGWHYLYIGLFFNAAFAVSRLFTADGGWVAMLSALVLSFISGYAIFQIRDAFNDTPSPHS